MLLFEAERQSHGRHENQFHFLTSSRPASCGYTLAVLHVPHQLDEPTCALPCVEDFDWKEGRSLE